jgi:gentisate 1,2-dioxygenase
MPGQGPPLPKHPYVEVAFSLEGRATFTVGDEQREVKAGGIVVIPADTPHRFGNSGDTTLRQIDENDLIIAIRDVPLIRRKKRAKGVSDLPGHLIADHDNRKLDTRLQRSLHG